MTPESPERHALRGLLLAIVEVQNLAREGNESTAFETMSDIYEHVESNHVREYVQLARAILDTPPPKQPRPQCTCPTGGVSPNCPVCGVIRAIPAEEAGVHR
jgi:hypothetical protein